MQKLCIQRIRCSVTVPISVGLVPIKTIVCHTTSPGVGTVLRVTSNCYFRTKTCSYKQRLNKFHEDTLKNKKNIINDVNYTLMHINKQTSLTLMWPRRR